MTEFNNSENPCENCLVKVICIKECSLLHNYAGKIVREIDHKICLTSHWFKHYELRSQAREHYKFKITQIKEAIKTHKIEVKNDRI